MDDKVTVVVLVGNSDDKLSQEKWARFIQGVYYELEGWGETIEFYGGSSFQARWQNACVVATMKGDIVAELKKSLARLCARYEQDSIAVVVGDTQFVRGE